MIAPMSADAIAPMMTIAMIVSMRVSPRSVCRFMGRSIGGTSRCVGTGRSQDRSAAVRRRDGPGVDDRVTATDHDLPVGATGAVLDGRRVRVVHTGTEVELRPRSM